MDINILFNSAVLDGVQKCYSLRFYLTFRCEHNYRLLGLCLLVNYTKTYLFGNAPIMRVRRDVFGG